MENRCLAVGMFFLVLVDEDRKLFNIVGPMTDDTAWGRKIVELQESGKNVRCFALAADRSVDEIVALYSRQTGYKYTKTLITETPQV
jgi:hypothetical protein